MESRSMAEGEKGGLIHFDPLPSAKQTPQTKASPKNITSTSATENSNAGTGWAPQHDNLHKANYAESPEIILNVIILISISNIYPNTPDRLHIFLLEKGLEKRHTGGKKVQYFYPCEPLQKYLRCTSMKHKS